MTVPSFESLSAERDAIKTECTTTSLLTVPSNEALKVQRSVMGTVTRFSDFLKSIGQKIGFVVDEDHQKNMVLSSADKQLLQKLTLAMDKGNYIDLMHVRVQTVPGQSTTWESLLDSWQPAVEAANNFFDLYLYPFEKFLSVAVSDPEKFSTLGHVVKINDVDIDGYKTSLQAPLQGNTKTNQKPYSECAGRNRDTVEALKRSLEYAETLNASNLNLVKESVGKVSKLLEILSEQITDSNLGYRLNPKTISDLSDLTFHLAKMTELYGATYAYVSSQKEAMEITSKKLIEMIR